MLQFSHLSSEAGKTAHLQPEHQGTVLLLRIKKNRYYSYLLLTCSNSSDVSGFPAVTLLKLYSLMPRGTGNEVAEELLASSC
jgi:hypothetical protein